MKDDRVYLRHIVECISNIESYTNDDEEAFFSLKIIQDAVIRNLEIIGEATKKISKEVKTQNQTLPWHEMAGLRDVLIHDYFGVDLTIVWNVVANELPDVKKKVADILNTL